MYASGMQAPTGPEPGPAVPARGPAIHDDTAGIAPAGFLAGAGCRSRREPLHSFYGPSRQHISGPSQELPFISGPSRNPADEPQTLEKIRQPRRPPGGKGRVVTGGT
ncbi:hypothetical protein [Streptomyces sp. GC420]|uniref:hypothetical protein n=1 Tax=Streptomyces sp. GC420 TaxID=2697568 RepID=UPI0014150744|nr:hypothetical protein [Streptomyces sp. GC420]NBM18832.1 hypothetical protein [Streptomyces sp. GC420]